MRFRLDVSVPLTSECTDSDPGNQPALCDAIFIASVDLDTKSSAWKQLESL